MDYTFKELLTIPSFSDFLLEEKGEEIDKRIKYFPIKGKPKQITKADYEKVAGRGKQIVKKAGFVIAHDKNKKAFYIKKPMKKGMTVKYDSEKKKFVYKFDLKGYKKRKRGLKKAMAKGKKKAIRTRMRTMKLRRRKK